MKTERLIIPAAALFALTAGTAIAGPSPTLPDYTMATFDASSSTGGNAFFSLTPDLLSVFEGFDEDEFERIESLVTRDTVNILGIENRVIRDTEYVDGLLVEVAEDWYAQDTDGNVWYFGEHVVNYEYDDDGKLIGTNNDGSWLADGVTNFPGIVMPAGPMVGDSYYQEFAPGIALDFAVINGLDGLVDIDFGMFTGVLETSEGNLFDGPELAENKLYAPGVGLVLIQGLDELGEVESEIELVEQRIVPAPAVPSAIGFGALLSMRRRRAE